MKFSFQSFSTTAFVAGLPNHRLYKDVDWEKVEAGFHAVVDPMEPSSILYLAEQDYIRQLRVSLSNDHTLKVLAKAGTSKVTTSASPASTSTASTTKTPPASTHPFLSEFYTGSRKSQKAAAKRVYHLFDTPFSDFLKLKKNFSGTVKSLMIPVSYGNIRDLLLRWYDLLVWWRTGSKTATLHRVEMNSFALYLRKLAKFQGINSVILHMKLGLFVLNSYVGGKKMTTTQELGRRISLRNGLPSFLPLYARQAIRSGNVRMFHIWASVLNSYKAMQGTWLVDDTLLSTIQTPHPDFSRCFIFSEFRDFIPVLWKLWGTSPVKDPKDLSVEKRRTTTSYDILFTAKSGPNGGPAMLGVGADAFAWRCQPRNLVSEWLTLTGAEITQGWLEKAASVWVSQVHSLINPIPGTLKAPWGYVRELFMGPNSVWICNEFKDVLMKFKTPGGDLWSRPVLRRLHALYEPAGKVRVIAIVDYWTQLVLKPLHLWMFQILKLIPQDATFDQEGKLLEFSKRGYSEFYSYDLKSATDLIPLRLYEELFKPMLPSKILSLWLELLVGLPFLKPKEFFREHPNAGLKNPTLEDIEHLNESGFVKYTCGQPMGALSSWASMALVHHALVWFAAFKAGVLREETSPLRRWSLFTGYLVLGDDIVIADAKVAEAYLFICTTLGIKIGLSKSFISDKLMNFANQTYLKDVNISPLSLREELNVRGLHPRMESALRAVRRGWIDLGKNGWVAPLLKLFVRPPTWELIRKDLQSGQNHPLVNWVLSALFAPGSNKVSLLKPTVSIEEYLATMSRKVLLWNKPLKDLALCCEAKRPSEYLRTLLLVKARKLKEELKRGSERLEGFEMFLLRQARGDIVSPLFMSFQCTARKRIEWWRREYNGILNLVSSERSLTMEDRAYLSFCEQPSLEALLLLINEAERSLPVIPSYEGKSLKDFFSSERVSDESKVFKIYLRQMELLKATDELLPDSP
jgi:hypothetical protein